MAHTHHVSLCKQNTATQGSDNIVIVVAGCRTLLACAGILCMGKVAHHLRCCGALCECNWDGLFQAAEGVPPHVADLHLESVKATAAGRVGNFVSQWGCDAVVGLDWLPFNGVEVGAGGGCEWREFRVVPQGGWGLYGGSTTTSIPCSLSRLKR